jgi:OFA family oxalate/formate antiporter-like MFS transporter
VRFPHGTIAVLGVVTIAAYGTWNYSFGVLLDPILSETGWSESWVAGAFSLSTALGAILAMPAGWLIDRAGSRSAFLVAATASGLGLVTASSTSQLALFVVGAVVGGGALHAFAFYHITQTTAVRAAPDAPARAIALLTIYGAFSSTIYLPTAAALVSVSGWRPTLRILALTTAGALVVAAFAVRERDRAPGSQVRPDFRVAFGRPAARRFAIATGLIGFGVGTVLVYQVPLMTDAGLSIGAAAWIAGARGAAQITGRIPLPWILARLGSRSAVRLAFGSITVGLSLLFFAGNIGVALAYVALAGFGIGATSPLQGIYANELFDRAHLGACMGVLTMVFGFSMALGPVMVGSLAEYTGDRWWGIGVAAVAGTGAVVQMSRPLPAEEVVAVG